MEIPVRVRALCYHQMSGVTFPSQTKRSSPSVLIAPWAWLSLAATCSRSLNSSGPVSCFLEALPLLWPPLRGSHPHQTFKLRFSQCCHLTVTKLSCAVAFRRLAVVSTAVSASLPMERQNCVVCTVTPSTRQSPAEPSTTLAIVPMAHAATSFMKRK